MTGPEDNPADDHQPTKEEWEAKMGMGDADPGATGGADELDAMAAMVSMLLPLTTLIRAAEAMTEADWAPIPVFRDACKELDKAMQYARRVKSHRRAAPPPAEEGTHPLVMYTFEEYAAIRKALAEAENERDHWKAKSEQQAAAQGRGVSEWAEYSRVCEDRDAWRYRAEQLAAAIKRTLADDESQPGGWGPDVTMQGVLKGALAAMGDGAGGECDAWRAAMDHIDKLLESIESRYLSPENLIVVGQIRDVVAKARAR